MRTLRSPRLGMQIIKNTFWLSICNAAGDFSGILLFLVIARRLGPGGSGEYAYAFAVAGVVALLSTSGLEEYGIREFVRTAPHERARLCSDLWTTQCAQLLLGAAALGCFLLTDTRHLASRAVIVELAVFLVGLGTARTLFVPSMAAQIMATPAITIMLCRVGAILCAIGICFVGMARLPTMLVGFPIAGVMLVAFAARGAIRARAAGDTHASPGSRWRPNSRGVVSARGIVNPRGVLSTARHTVPFAAAEVLGQFYTRADILLIGYLLGSAEVGLYAADIKIVEVCLMPVVFLGTAAYPALAAAGARGPSAFARPARELARLDLFLGGWLAVALYCLVPLLIVPLFGRRFAPAEALLPWIAVFAVLKSGEIALCRLLYAVRRQALYAGSLAVGTILIIVLDLLLIPRMGLAGAVCAVIASDAVINIICLNGLRKTVAIGDLISAFARTTAALAATAAAVIGARAVGADPWAVAVIGCSVFPLAGAAAGLLPRPAGSHLLSRGLHPRTTPILPTHPPP